MVYEEEFDGGVDTAPTAPDTNQEIHWYQGKLPEHIKQEQILCQEYPYHTNLQQQEKEHKVSNSLFDCRPGREDRNGSQECGQQQEQNAQAIHTHMVGDRPGRHLDPWQIDHQLQIRIIRIELQQYSNRNAKGNQ